MPARRSRRSRTSPRRLLVVDGHSVAFRAWYAIPDSLRDARGAPANATYGFLNILFRVLRDQRPTHLAVTFDLGAPFREQIDPAYKAHREVGPEDLSSQVEALRHLLAALEVPVFEVEGFEADDLIATLARQARAAGARVVVLTGDQDLLQIVRPGVRVLLPGRRFSEPEPYDSRRVRERFGVRPRFLADYKGLAGDASDGIPGVRGIGAKTARALLERYETLERLFAHVDDVEPTRARNALRAGREDAWRSRTLARLRDDAPIDLDLARARLAGIDRRRAERTLKEHGFAGLARRIPGVFEAAP